VKVTPEKKVAFCAALAASGGSITRACQAIDVTRMTAYRWRDDDQAFAKDWEAAKAAGLDALEDEALRRAYEGYDKPIVHQGIITDTVKEYSDTLAIFLLKGGKPEKYRDNARMELTGANGGPLVIDDAARAARVAALLKKAGERKDLDDLV
jgi:transposase-like protein